MTGRGQDGEQDGGKLRAGEGNRGEGSQGCSESPLSSLPLGKVMERKWGEGNTGVQDPGGERLDLCLKRPVEGLPWWFNG